MTVPHRMPNNRTPPLSSTTDASDSDRQDSRHSREQDDVRLLRSNSPQSETQMDPVPETPTESVNARDPEKEAMARVLRQRPNTMPIRANTAVEGLGIKIPEVIVEDDEKDPNGIVSQPRPLPQAIPITRGRSVPAFQRAGPGLWRIPSTGLVVKVDQRLSAPLTPVAEPPHYSILTRRQKQTLVYIVSLAAIFSPLSSNIYFPAIDTIAKVLNTPIDYIALTVTIYMLFQGIAPSFWGPLADTYGRRPILIATLLVYIVANLGLAVSHSYASLMVFRGFQAIGSSATIAIGAGVIGDISVASERGGFMGLFGGIRMFGQAVGPVIGGALSEYGGFRSIFWTLLGMASLVTIFLIFFLPETLRKIAGNGSRPLYGIYKPLYQKLRRKNEHVARGDRYDPGKPTWREMLDSFRLLGESDVFVTLMFGAIIYTVWSMITSSTSTLFKKEYQLSDVLIGLIFVPNGLGCVLGSLVTGRLMDWEYKRVAILYREAKGLEVDEEIDKDSHPDFPLEKARLASTWWLLLLFCVSTGVYGYATQWHIAVPLIMQFISAFTATSIFNVNSTIMIDLYPSKPATATAINNLVRCTLGAIGVACVEKAMAKIDEGPTFAILAGISALSGLLVVVELIWGPKWRGNRRQREIRARDKAREREQERDRGVQT